MEKYILLTFDQEDLRSVVEEVVQGQLKELLKDVASQLDTIEDQVFNSVEAARFLGVSRVTLAKWIEKESVPFKRMGSRLLFSKRQLLEWIHKEDRDISIKRRSI
jgi:excisionase family DNA binding protein